MKVTSEKEARAVLAEFNRAAPLTAHDGDGIVRAWAQAAGWAADGYGNRKKPGGAERLHFTKTRVNRQLRHGRSWATRDGATLLDAGLDLVVQAADRVNDQEAYTWAMKQRAKRERRSEKSAERAVRARDAEVVSRWVGEHLAHEAPDAVLLQGRGERVPEAQFAELMAQRAELMEKGNAQHAAGQSLEPPAYNIDRPPVQRVFYKGAPNYWLEAAGGVAYSVRISHHEKGRARVNIGDTGAYLQVDPFALGISMRAEDYQHEARGDGGIVGKLVDITERGKRFVLPVLTLIVVRDAEKKRQGTGRRLMQLWCRLVRGFAAYDGVEPRFAAEAPGEEGQPFIDRLVEKGELVRLARRGSTEVLKCA